MKNLAQIRAKAALDALRNAPEITRQAVNKLPAMIMANGLLATFAFCNAESTGENRFAMKKAVEATARYLANRGLTPKESEPINKTIEYLSQQDSHRLQIATDEAIAFIAYLKRFAPGENED
ncbi:MAG: type III-B CRISPR module-associated protein Cmr5 [Verrucomicrobiae bacterium]|nr:type III-B CRISPR module-associated protein Cmr5 [Verrucomicrobiae bacterium]